MSATTAALPPLAAAEPTPKTLTAAAHATPHATAASHRLAWLQASRRSVPAARLVAWIDVQVVLMVAVLTGVLPEGFAPDVKDLLTARVGIADLLPVALFAASVLVVFEFAGLYEAALVRRWRDEWRRLVTATAAIAVLLGTASSVRQLSVDWPALLPFCVVGCVLVAAARGVRARVTRSVAGSRRVLIVGSGPQAVRICQELSTDPLTAYQVVGFVDSSDAPRSPFVRRRTIGAPDALEQILVREHVDEVHVGLPVKSHYREIQETIRVCERIGVKVMYGADIFGTGLARARVGQCGASPRVELQLAPEGTAMLIKRAGDLFGAATLLLVLAPLLLLTALAIKLTSEGPVLFAQERYGLNRRKFRMFKFRTMVVNAEQLQAALEAQNEVQGAAFKIARDPRVTPIGRLLRRGSIDELPQLFNVLRGEMSLIGPRPLPNRDVQRFTRTADMRRFSVRPGLTGLWQVSGRTRLAFDEWIRLDLHYIDNWSLLLDFRILARTLPAVVRGTGAA